MKKSLVLAVAAASVMAFAAPAFAAPVNPFADVRADHWAYEAVTGLYKAGLVSGNEGKFMGTTSMTRYEMAQVVYAAMQKMEKATPDQKAAIEKLQKEFATELKGLGARIAKLEAGQKAPSVIMMGQVRFTAAYRNDKQTNAAIYGGLNKDKKSFVTYRTRLEAYAPFGKDFAAFIRLRAQDYDVNYGSFSGAGSMGQVKVEQQWFSWNKPFGLNTKAQIGRQGFWLGKGGLQMAVGDVDLVTLTGKVSNVNWKAFYGNLGTVSFQNLGEFGRFAAVDFNTKISKKVTVGGFYEKKIWIDDAANGLVPTGKKAHNKDFSVISGNFDVKVSKNLSVMGEFAKNTAVDAAGGTADLVAKPKAYWVGVTTGDPSLYPAFGLSIPWAKNGAQSFGLVYKYIETGAVPATWNQNNSILGNTTGGLLKLDNNVKGFEAVYTRALASNVVLVGQAGTMKQAKKTLAEDKLTNYAIAQLYFQF